MWFSPIAYAGFSLSSAALTIFLPCLPYLPVPGIIVPIRVSVDHLLPVSPLFKLASRSGRLCSVPVRFPAMFTGRLLSAVAAMTSPVIRVCGRGFLQENTVTICRVRCSFIVHANQTFPPAAASH